MNMNVFIGSDLVCSPTIRSVYNFVMRILGYLGRPTTILICTSPLRTPVLTILPFCSS